MKIVAVATTPDGQRVEATLDIPDAYAASIDTGNARERTRAKLQQAADVAAENIYVARKDYDVQRHSRKAVDKKAPRGPDQVAFAGSKEPAVEVPNTGNVSHADALRMAGFEERTDRKTKRKTVHRLDEK